MSFDRSIEEIIEIVVTALNQVPQDFYKLKTTYSENGIIRERIFCYELYHLMRKNQELLGTSPKFTLHGEIDKSGHYEFSKTDQKNPDFVFHVPGKMNNNSLVVEVKGKITPLADIVKDFRTLHKFTSTYNYKAGLFILYNHTVDQLKQKIGETLLTQFETNKTCIPEPIVTREG